MDAIADAVYVSGFDAVDCSDEYMLVVFAVRSRESICDDVGFTTQVSDVGRKLGYVGKLVCLPRGVWRVPELAIDDPCTT